MRRIPALIAGLIAGLVGASVLALVMLAGRTWLGISPLPEAVPDRIAPTLDVDEFLRMLSDYGGYNQLKQFGIKAGIGGVVGAGALAGVVVGLVDGTRRARAQEKVLGLSRDVVALLGGLVVVVTSALVVFLWPVLDANFNGISPTWARPIAVGFLFGQLAVLAVVIGAVYRLLTSHVQTRGAGEAPSRGTVDPPVALASRRAVVAVIAGAAVAAPAYALGRRLYDDATFDYDGTINSGADLTPVTSNERFYVVTKNVVDPDVNRDVWRLEVDGLVEDETDFTYDELVALGPVEQETTVMCISNKIAAGLMSNAVWTGVPMATLLERAGVKAGAVEVLLSAADGYTDTFSIEKAMEPTTLVVFQMNGEEIPRVHGYPVRVIVPGLFGEKQVKWVTRIEVVDHDAKGFYEQQGWGPRFEVPTRSDFFAPRVGSGGGGFRFNQEFAAGQEVTLKGRAFGGDRGISKVEVSVDNGTSWEAATIDYPSKRDMTWAFWSYVWRPAAGEYTLVVRAYDGTGALQETERRASYPREGSTGLHVVTARVV